MQPHLKLTDFLSSTFLPNAAAGDTKGRLIRAGETLIAERGLAGTSLEEIAKAAGQSNKYAVQYHFENKAGLIRAIFERRLSQIRVRRAELLRNAEGLGLENDIPSLLETLAIPLAEQVNEDGHWVYARFWFHNSVDAGFDRFDASWFGLPMSSETDPTVIVNERLAALSGKTLPEMHRLLFLFGNVFQMVVIDHDNQHRAGQTDLSLESSLADAVRRVAAAIRV